MTELMTTRTRTIISSVAGLSFAVAANFGWKWVAVAVIARVIARLVFGGVVANSTDHRVAWRAVCVDHGFSAAMWGAVAGAVARAIVRSF